MNKCRICGTEDNHQRFNVQEMMFGTSESFIYFKCNQCECTQISHIPENLAKYYPRQYKPHGKAIFKRKKIKRFLKKKISEQCTASRKNLTGKVLYPILGAGFVEKLKNTKIGTDAKILDIGAGSGKTLMTLYEYGFNNLTGTDIFIDQDVLYENGIKVYKKDIKELTDKYDLIMLNHVLEHMDNHLEVLEQLAKLLNKNGLLIIRIPVIGGYTWRKYQSNWVAFDAPRHLYIHSVKSLMYLADKSKFKLANLTYDSSEYQFWASEQYQRNISMYDDKSYYLNKSDSIFSKKDIKYFRKKAIELNQLKDGNAAMFHFKLHE